MKIATKVIFNETKKDKSPTTINKIAKPKDTGVECSGRERKAILNKKNDPKVRFIIVDS